MKATRILSLFLLLALALGALTACAPSYERIGEKLEKAGYTLKYDVDYDVIEKVYADAGEEFEKGAVYRVLFAQDPNNPLRWPKVVEFYEKEDADTFYRLHEYEYSRPQAGTTIVKKGKIVFYGTPSVYDVVK